MTYQTSFTMRRATGLTLQPQQILRLAWKITRVIDARHIWNVIYNARSNRHHPPTSPNTAPAMQYCNPKCKRNLAKTIEASFTARGRFDHDRTMIRAWNCKTEAARSPSLLFPPLQRNLYWKLQHFALRLSTQIWPNTAPAAKSDTATSPNAVPATKSDTATGPNSAPAMTSDKTVTLLNYYITELLLDWAVATLLSCYLTERLLDWAVATLVSCYLTVPNSAPATKSDTATGPNSAPATKSDKTVTLLNWYIILCWAVAKLLSCYLTELLLYWSVTSLSCYFTELLLYWTVTLLSWYFTELVRFWAVTLLNCYFTELLLYWAVTLLSCYLTLLYWTVTLLNCYFTELLLYWTLCIFKSP